MLDYNQDKPQEKCGIVGVYSTSNEAARTAYYALWSLQHRGQESSGIASSDGKKIYRYAGQGLVANVYKERDLKKLKGNIAIGHNRYATSGSSSIDHAQPIYRKDNYLATAHNGNIPLTIPLKKALKRAGITTHGHNDSELLHKVVRHRALKYKNLARSVSETLSEIPGVYSLVFLNKNSLIAARDPYGIRPLSVAKTKNGYCVSSETCVFETIGATFIRDIKPGEMVEITEKGIKSTQFAKPNLKLDVFEYVYFARPDSILLNRSVYEVRKNLGKQLSLENPSIKGDLVIPIPDSAIPAAIGFSQASGIPFETALIKNRYIHRTFIKPAQSQRENSVKLKLNPISYLIKGKNIIIIDDSIVRGTTSKKIISMLKTYGAKKVTFLVSSAPVKYPDFYGINTPNPKELIAANYSTREIQNIIGADTLKFLSFKGMIKSIGVKQSNLNTSCFTGIYPVPVRSNTK